MLQRDLLRLFALSVHGHVPDPGECPLREEVKPLLAGLPRLARLVTRQMEARLIRPRLAGREHLGTNLRSLSDEPPSLLYALT